MSAIGASNGRSPANGQSPDRAQTKPADLSIASHCWPGGFAPGRRVVAIWLVGLFAATGCGGAKLKGRVSAVEDMIATARKSGAQRCAPVELAMAESHVAFARQELSEGRYYQARDEIGVAEKSAHEAIRKSPKDLCVLRVVVEKRPEKKKLVVTPIDSDGDGIVDNDDQCPDKPEDVDSFQDEDGCPDDDNDNDGLVDTIDNCPNNPEDKDGFQDDDGCPDEDNDSDGLADSVDQCPNEPEDKDGFQDDDGCPDCDNDGDGVVECPEPVDKCPDKAAETPDGCPQKYKLLVVTESKIELKQTVYFATRRARIKRRSYGLLDEVARALDENSTIRVRIEGHTDSRGRERFNLRLSRSRAQAVRKYLIKRGIAPDRMVAKGFGEDKPIADNRTRAGRAQNRRVEFVITER